MLIDVSNLVGRVGERKEIELELAVPLEEGDALVSGKLELLGAENSVLATFKAGADVPAQCSRCLRPMIRYFKGKFTREFKKLSESPDEPAILEGMIDVLTPIREEIVVSEPITLLHAPDCKGLCPVCGKDRNLVVCGHEEVVEKER